MKKVKVSGNFAFDWRKTNFCHCTVKAISLSDEMPKKKILEDYIAKSKKVLDRQKSFHVKIKDIAKFPTALFAGVESKELTNLHKNYSRFCLVFNHNLKVKIMFLMLQLVFCIKT